VHPCCENFESSERKKNRMSTEELRNYATVVSATIAVLVFIVNAYSQMRSRRIENLTRFNQAHQRLFASGTCLALNLVAMETGTMRRNLEDLEMETRFQLLLLEIERLATLVNNCAVPRHTQVYMFGSYAPRLPELMTDKERASMFWELAVGYLDGIARDSERYAKLTRSEHTRLSHPVLHHSHQRTRPAVHGTDRSGPKRLCAAHALTLESCQPHR
jgi:hypothetical protein